MKICVTDPMRYITEEKREDGSRWRVAVPVVDNKRVRPRDKATCHDLLWQAVAERDRRVLLPPHQKYLKQLFVVSATGFPLWEVQSPEVDIGIPGARLQMRERNGKTSVFIAFVWPIGHNGIKSPGGRRKTISMKITNPLTCPESKRAVETIMGLSSSFTGPVRGKSKKAVMTRVAGRYAELVHGNGLFQDLSTTRKA